jgi:hypothetical protein
VVVVLVAVVVVILVLVAVAVVVVVLVAVVVANARPLRLVRPRGGIRSTRPVTFGPSRGVLGPQVTDRHRG